MRQRTATGARGDSQLPKLYAPLVEACEANGIGRTLAFELARTGVLKTVKVGGKRLLVLESLYALGQVNSEPVRSRMPAGAGGAL